MIRNTRIALSGALLLATAGCGSSAPPELKQAAQAMASMAAPVHLARSAFAVAYPECRPSEYVSYLFSPMGTAEWPPREGGVESYEVEAAKSIGATVLPAGVQIIPFEWRPGGGAQLVIRADDEAGLVILEGYGRDDVKPVLRREIRLAVVEPDAFARELFRANADMGIGYQSVDPSR